MSWTKEQTAVMLKAGINPDYVPWTVREEEPVEVEVVDGFTLLQDEEYSLISAFFPQPVQANAAPNRKILDALLWLDRTNKRVTQVPKEFGSAEAIRKRAERWAVAQIWELLLVQLDCLPLTIARREALRRIASRYVARGRRIREWRQM